MKIKIKRHEYRITSKDLFMDMDINKSGELILSFSKKKKLIYNTKKENK